VDDAYQFADLILVTGDTNRACAHSDLDLALGLDRPLALVIIGEIAEALYKSDLPFKVDIVDLAMVDPGFRNRVLADCISLAGSPLANSASLAPSLNGRMTRCGQALFSSPDYGASRTLCSGAIKDVSAAIPRRIQSAR
jgi:hypothetical protein